MSHLPNRQKEHKKKGKGEARRSRSEPSEQAGNKSGVKKTLIKA